MIKRWKTEAWICKSFQYRPNTCKTERSGQQNCGLCDANSLWSSCSIVHSRSHRHFPVTAFIGLWWDVSPQTHFAADWRLLYVSHPRWASNYSSLSYFSLEIILWHLDFTFSSCTGYFSSWYFISNYQYCQITCWHSSQVTVYCVQL